MAESYVAKVKSNRVVVYRKDGTVARTIDTTAYGGAEQAICEGNEVVVYCNDDSVRTFSIPRGGILRRFF